MFTQVQVRPWPMWCPAALLMSNTTCFEVSMHFLHVVHR